MTSLSIQLFTSINTSVAAVCKDGLLMKYYLGGTLILMSNSGRKMQVEPGENLEIHQVLKGSCISPVPSGLGFIFGTFLD